MNIPVIKSQDAFWEELDVTVYLESEMDVEQSNSFQDLIESWYILGLYGGLGGNLRSISKVWAEGTEVGFTVDMGTAEYSALDSLCRAVEGFALANDVKVSRIVLGMEAEGRF